MSEQELTPEAQRKLNFFMNRFQKPYFTQFTHVEKVWLLLFAIPQFQQLQLLIIKSVRMDLFV